MPANRSVKQIEIYRMDSENGRWAEIYFRFENEHREFSHVVYDVGRRNPYNLTDWAFLGDVSLEIRHILKGGE